MKKKNLLKCLALTSMLALSVGAVTSCGTQGETGPKGETGAQGPKGETGEKGDKGDTYYPVVILSKGVTTDVISGKAGDTYTLTFTGWETGKEVVNKLFINYEEVELTDEIINGSYTGTFSEDAKNGAVVVSAEFGTVVSYAQNLLTEYYDALVEVDSDLKSSTAADESQGERTSYFDNSLRNLYDSGKTAIAEADDKAETVSERLALVREVLETQKSAIETAYDALISTAKTNAKAGLDLIYAASSDTADSLTGRTEMSNEDRAAMLSAAKAAVDNASTLAEIGALVGKDTNVANNSSKNGSYNKLEEARASVFSAISSALEDVHTTDSAFTVDGSGDSYKDVVSKLKEFGIEESELPLKVAETYVAKASTATSLPAVSETDSTVALAKEASEKIKGAYTSILSKLQEKIIASYDAEINAYTEDSQWIYTAHTEVKNLLENWVKLSRNVAPGNELAPVTVSNLVSYKADNNSKKGGLQYVEENLASWNLPFTASRIEQAQKTVKDKIVAYAKTYTDKDSKYASLLTSETPNGIKGDDTTYTYNVTTTAAKWSTSANTIITIKEAETSGKASIDSAYNQAFEKYLTDWNTLNGVGDTAVYTTLSGLQSVEGNNVYNSSTKKAGLTNSDDNVLGQDTTLLENAYKAAVRDSSIVAEDFAAVDTWVTNVKSYISLIGALNEGVTDFTEAGEEKSMLKEKIVQEKKDIIEGKVTTSAQVSAYVTNLKQVYADAVADYLAEAKEALLAVRDAKIAAITNGDSGVQTPEKVNAIRTAYTNGLAAITETEDGQDDEANHKYPCKTKASVNKWYAHAVGLINTAAGA